jgi:hypothetical protein
MDLQKEYFTARTWIEAYFAERLAIGRDVNLFEATIRVLQGLLSAYALSGEKDQLYRALAEDTARRLVKAFVSPSGIPYSDVHLADGRAHGPHWTMWSSTAEVATLHLEFRYLARITGLAAEFQSPADRTERAVIELSIRHNKSGLVPTFIDPVTGKFQSSEYTLGARGDSYYEYLLKLWLHAGGVKDGSDPSAELLVSTYLRAVEGVRVHMLKLTPDGTDFTECASAHELVECGDVEYNETSHRLLYIADLSRTFSAIHKMDHLACFFPDLLALDWSKGLGHFPHYPSKDHLEIAKRLAYPCIEILRPAWLQIL